MRRELEKRAIPEDYQNQGKNIGFKEMYRSLQRAKQILIAITELLGINDDEESGSGIIGKILGKRQRTE